MTTKDDSEQPVLIGSGGIVIDAATVLRRIQELEKKVTENSGHRTETD